MRACVCVCVCVYVSVRLFFTALLPGVVALKRRKQVERDGGRALLPLARTFSLSRFSPHNTHTMPPHPDVTSGGKSVAVVGSGVTGLAAAWLLKQ